MKYHLLQQAAEDYIYEQREEVSEEGIFNYNITKIAWRNPLALANDIDIIYDIKSNNIPLYWITQSCPLYCFYA